MDAKMRFHLIRPCKNRGLSYVDNKDGSISINGVRFESYGEAEDYLEMFPRKDI